MTRWTTVFPEEDFSLPSQYIRVLDGESANHCMCLVNSQWYQTLITQNRRNFTLEAPPTHPVLSPAEVSLLLNQQSSPQIQPPWERLDFFRVNLNPTAKILRFTSEDFPSTSTVSRELLDNDAISLIQNRIQFSHIRKKYGKCMQGILDEEEGADFAEAWEVVRDLCGSVLHCPFLDFSGQSAAVPVGKSVSNILLPVFVACLVDHFVIALPYRPFCLTSCLRFSSSLLACDSAKYFLLYQILQAISRFQERDFYAGNFTLDDISIRQDLWVEINPVVVFRSLSAEYLKTSAVEKSDLTSSGESAQDDTDNTCKLSEWTTLWCLGKISNYDYLLALNQAAGRTYGHPDYHPIFPWVVDFTSPNSGWRDLAKSKYRLTKGDRQLDLTYETTETGMVAHHIPETFSDLTFYIYNARRVPKSILCQHVRKRWVPAEYPSSLERLYNWSPDESIPDFYSDPEIFHSIHSDLPDLALPYWCETVTEFLSFHRGALESRHVTNHLHHWIDLNFGYKLAGEAAVTAKNVVLSLRTPQKQLKGHGIQQLFAVAHPPVFRTAAWYERELPLLRAKKRKTKDVTGDNMSVSSLEMDEVVVEPERVGEDVADRAAEIGTIEELENLEALMNFCLSVDSAHPDVLSDYIPNPSAVQTTKLDGLKQDLQAFGCCAAQIFCVSGGSANWPDFADLKDRVTYTTQRLSSLARGTVDMQLAANLKDLLDAGVFPYSARQILARHDRILPIPDYLPRLYQFVCTLDGKANLDALESVLEEINPCDLDMIATFILQRLTSPLDRCKFAVLLLDPVVKFFGPSKSAEIFLPCLSRLYSEFPPVTSPDHPFYLQLFSEDFLRAMLIRFGGEIFMRHLTVPLIEKLTDLQEILGGPVRGVVNFAVGDGFGEDTFAKDLEGCFGELAAGGKEGVAAAQNRAGSALIGLAEKVGPLLTARFISGNLLRSLALCYVEEEKLEVLDLDFDGQEHRIQKHTITGDLPAWIVSDTLIQITHLFGQCFIWDQYLPYCAELVKDALRRLTPMNEAGLLGCIEFLPQILPHLTETSLREHLPFQLINDVLYPLVELLTSFSHLFPSGGLTRRLLAGKWLNLVLGISNRIGRESAQDLVTRPLLVTFFGVFTQLYGKERGGLVSESIAVPEGPEGRGEEVDEMDLFDGALGSPFVLVRTAGDEGEEFRAGTPGSLDSFPSSPPTTTATVHRSGYESGDNEDILKELKSVFTESLAFDAYIPFCKLLGQFHMDEKLLNNDLLHEISISKPHHPSDPASRFQGNVSGRRPFSAVTSLTRSQSAKLEGAGSPVDASDGAMLSRSFHSSTSMGPAMGGSGLGASDGVAEITGEEEEEALFFAEVRESASDRTLRGNWLAYWQHELGQSRRDEPWNVKQIPLQTFSAHSAPVKSICVLDCEYSFMTASKDKTVRLWSIRNSGDGSLISPANGLYLDHKRPVTDLRFLARERLAASTDGIVNLWDPWTLTTVSRIEVVSQASFIACPPAPSSVLFVGHMTEDRCFVSGFDVRARIGPCGTGQFQVAPNSPGVLRCLVVSPDDTWFACGFSSGVISVFDQRTGIMSATWKPYESDVTQLIPVSSHILASLGSDGTVFLWDLKREVDDRLLNSVRGFSEPILQATFAGRASGGDLLVLMANNRIGVVADLLRGGTAITTSKIRHDALKGSFSTVAVLPMNRQLLLGGDTGSTLLMC